MCKISTPVMRIMLTMANMLEIIISDMAHTVYIRFPMFSNFSKLQLVLHKFENTVNLIYTVCAMSEMMI